MNIREQLHKARYGPICRVGGDSSADNSQTVKNDTQDNRIAAAANSTNLSMSRATVGNVAISTTTTDHGAVDGAFKLVGDMAKGSINANTHALDAVAGAWQSSSEAVAKAYANDSATMADAYKTAKAGEQKILVGAVVGLVALVAIKIGGH